MSVVLKASDNTIIVDGKVVETVKKLVYLRDTIGTTNNLTSEPSVLFTQPFNISQISTRGMGDFAGKSTAHTIFLDTSGKAYATGMASYGALGLGVATAFGGSGIITTPRPITYFTTTSIQISAISAGGVHTIFLGTNDRVYATGHNNMGQLGLGEYTDTHRYTPDEITYFTTNSIQISAISTGAYHSIFLGTNGRVYACGAYNNGALGLGMGPFMDMVPINTPAEITYFTTNSITISAISAGEYHTIFLGNNGRVYSAGLNTSGQLGLGDTNMRHTPTLITYFTTNNIIISKISAGNGHTIFLGISGLIDYTGPSKVYSTGRGNDGQLGLGTTGQRNTPAEITYFTNNSIIISNISAGGDSSFFLETHNEWGEDIFKVYSVGLNANGQLGTGNLTSISTPTPIPYFNNIQMKSVAAGSAHTIFLDTGGIVYATGRGNDGQLGLGNTGQRNTPEPITNYNVPSVAVNATTGTGGDINHKLYTLSTAGRYTISIPIYTQVNINSGPDLALLGNYDIIISSRSSLIPSTGNTLSIIPLSPTAISSIVIRYHLRIPLVVNYQWTYNAANPNVYYPTGGNVGIGTQNPTNLLHVAGNTFSTTYSASSKTFKIEHPLKLNKWLYHGCIEGPRFDNIYRGKTLIRDGKADVDIDVECNTTGGMTSGTFPALNTNSQLFLRNNETYDRVKGAINGSIITIECENTTDEIEVDWLVIGERHDEHVINTELTDSEGNLICEHDMPRSTETDSDNIPVTNVDITDAT
jgi:alpha-tubulin suppressor-like RCC1 family protein